jgi:2-polyprenyl-3-methyl-5-hydroxy-6-metoxy-1,4-benzoquinol methylase
MNGSKDEVVLPTQAIAPEAEFDGFSDAYQELLERSVWITGEKAEYFAELKAQYLMRLAGPSFSGKVLDFGCGIGLVSRFMKVHLPAACLHGFDLSPASLSMVPAALRAEGKFTSVLSEVDSDYDLIVAANVMHHVDRASRQDVIKDLASRLVPAGKLVIFEHNPLNPLTRWAVKICPFDVGVHLLWPAEVLTHLKAAGMLRHRRQYITFFPHWLAWLRSFESQLGWCPLGGQYVVVGEAGSASSR